MSSTLTFFFKSSSLELQGHDLNESWLDPIVPDGILLKICASILDPWKTWPLLIKI